MESSVQKTKYVVFVDGDNVSNVILPVKQK